MISDRIDLNDWKNCDILTDDLWLFPNRDNQGKHKNIYHGNFIPQIPYQLISRYTKSGEVVLDPFFGSGTTLFECEKLNRKFIGLDINPEMFNYVKSQMFDSKKDFFAIHLIDNTDEKVKNYIQSSLNFLKEKSVSFAIFHPPYHNIVKFTDNKNDLSNCQNVDDFLNKFQQSLSHSLTFLEKNRYFAIVIGDIYQKSEVVPLSFLCMNMIKSNFKTKLKGIIVKNIEGNRGKLGAGGIWRYRALKNDYYIFKHEYIFVFKKEF